MHPNFAGALLNSALYLVCVFVAGLVTGHRFAWECAIVAMGWTYASHVTTLTTQQLGTPPRHISVAITWASMALGAIAGIALLF